jgi:hypothetical protein
MQPCVQVNVLYSWLGVPKIQFLKAAFYCKYFQVSSAVVPRAEGNVVFSSMSLHGIQEIRKLLNVSVNNSFVASLCSVNLLYYHQV